jgi:hypothetical protein
VKESPGALKSNPNEDETAMDVDGTAVKREGVESTIAAKRREMDDASLKKDYVLAGQLQMVIQHLEQHKPQLLDLECHITEAAKNGDFIPAGRFQEQYQALANSDTLASEANQNNSSAAMWDQGDNGAGLGGLGGLGGPTPGVASLGGAGTGEPAPGGLPPFMSPGPAGLVKNVFAPPRHRFNAAAPANYQWGSGNALHATASKPQEAQKPAAKKAPIPADRLCRLRIRLPDNRTMLEDFDSSDPLSAVYRLVEKLMPSEKEEITSTRTPLNARSGAFSHPLSSAGFTLLLSRPKREFSLEMHGTKSLEELNLAPSATLIVMRCHERGVVHRGELESRLREVQGNAMELEGLTYEALLELVERVGAAAPPAGAVSLTLSKEDLEQNTEMMSPSSFLAAGVPEEEQKCPICLGQYSPQEETECFLKLNRCGHVFHNGCFATWLRTRSSCPLCKTSMVG